MTTSSPTQATEENAFSLNSPQSPGTAWPVAHRTAFRWASCFIVLALLPFPFGAGSFYETTLYQRTWFAAASWLCMHVLYLTLTPVWLRPTRLPTTSSDTWNYCA